MSSIEDAMMRVKAMERAVQALKTHQPPPFTEQIKCINCNRMTSFQKAKYVRNFDNFFVAALVCSSSCEQDWQKKHSCGS